MPLQIFPCSDRGINLQAHPNFGSQSNDQPVLWTVVEEAKFHPLT